MLLIGLQSEKVNIESEKNIYINLLNEMLNMTNSVMLKYVERSRIISMEVQNNNINIKNNISAIINNIEKD